MYWKSVKGAAENKKSYRRIARGDDVRIPCGVFKTESGDCTTGVSDEVNL